MLDSELKSVWTFNFYWDLFPNGHNWFITNSAEAWLPPKRKSKHFIASAEASERVGVLILVFVRPMIQTAAFSCCNWQVCSDTISDFFLNLITLVSQTLYMLIRQFCTTKPSKDGSGSLIKCINSILKILQPIHMHDTFPLSTICLAIHFSTDMLHLCKGIFPCLIQLSSSASLEVGLDLLTILIHCWVLVLLFSSRFTEVWFFF